MFREDSECYGQLIIISLHRSIVYTLGLPKQKLGLSSAAEVTFRRTPGLSFAQNSLTVAVIESPVLPPRKRFGGIFFSLCCSAVVFYFFLFYCFST
ncbi:hypothetical protein CEXT_709961 [Caerostris extrusa]|uniref:Uncharacterized protein n=1 Tax=Caerostris extrusa TaxID=172846 RepID=A0AAV4VTJ5_CAEEX|nr:hypothetical protein CEXT_709961 [Caerostris extrusa]